VQSNFSFDKDGLRSEIGEIGMLVVVLPINRVVFQNMLDFTLIGWTTMIGSLLASHLPTRHEVNRASFGSSMLFPDRKPCHF
jgi:hypothetical protein